MNAVKLHAILGKWLPSILHSSVEKKCYYIVYKTNLNDMPEREKERERERERRKRERERERETKRKEREGERGKV
jgi:hypothetical protein